MKAKGLIWRLLREPLVHFLILGAGLFLVFEPTRDAGQADGRRIVVTPGQVEQLAAQFSRTWSRPPTADELDGLLERYVRSEIFYREAQAMGLGQDDPYVRNRLALKLEILLDDLSAEAEPDDGELARFIDQHSERFVDPARLSFQHVYLDPDRHADPVATAQRLLERLRRGADPDGLGDTSMLVQGLDGATADEIARHFGADFAATLEGLGPGRWSGPVRSAYGLHLVRITDYQSARQPALAEVRDAVLVEWREQRRREAKAQAYRRLRERYEVVIEPGAGEAPIADTEASDGAAGARAAAGKGTAAAPPALMPEAAQARP